LRATATRASDGRMVDMNARTIGSIRACFGPASDPAVSNFYGEFNLGSVPFKGSGGCRGRSDYPDKGLRSLNCSAELSGLPNGYVGGLLTTNSLTSLKTLGLDTDPPGYTQSSIVTIRLWKKRPER
jgi:hypothetical protein